jgi:hypothetical protein
MQLLTWIDNSALVEWLTFTSWVYPWVISFHSIGMAFLVGVLLMIILRVLGVGSFSIAPLGRFIVVVRIAFALTLLTGVTLLIIDVQRFVFSPTFQIKMLFIVLAGGFAIALIRMTFRDGADWSASGSAPMAVRVVAAVSLVCWAGAIAAGRLTAYLP